MSFLNNTAATPGRVLALLRLVRTLQGTAAVTRQQIEKWMTPDVKGANGTLKQRPTEGLSHTLKFVTELELLQGPSEGPWTTNRDWNSIEDVADAVHARLTGALPEHEDAVIFAVYAALVLKTANGWTFDQSKKDLIVRLDDTIKAWREDRTGNFFSDAKAGTFEDWADAMGLLLSGENRIPFAPYPIGRMRREISVLKTQGKTIQMAEFWRLLTGRMPYLDEGRVWESVRVKINAPAFSGELSPAASWPLLRLEEERLIELQYLPDAPSTYRLLGRAQAVSTVTLAVGE